MDLSFSVAEEVAPRYDTLAVPDGGAGRVWFHRRYAGPYPFHRHKESEMNLVLSGEAAYLVSDRESGAAARRHRLRRGSMIWLYPTEDHLLLDPSPDFTMWIVVWTPETVARFGATPIVGSHVADLVDDVVEHLAAVLADIVDADKNRDDDRRDTGISYLLLTAKNAHQRAIAPPTGPGIHPAVARAARLLRDETDPLTMDDLARRAGGLSASRLARLFTAQMGVGIATFRNRERLERFRRRRAAPESAEESLLEAALACGFGSYAQFHRVYVEAMGYPPSRLRPAD